MIVIITRQPKPVAAVPAVATTPSSARGAEGDLETFATARVFARRADLLIGGNVRRRGARCCASLGGRETEPARHRDVPTSSNSLTDGR